MHCMDTQNHKFKCPAVDRRLKLGMTSPEKGAKRGEKKREPRKTLLSNTVSSGYVPRSIFNSTVNSGYVPRSMSSQVS